MMMKIEESLLILDQNFEEHPAKCQCTVDPRHVYLLIGLINQLTNDGYGRESCIIWSLLPNRICMLP